MKRRILIVDDDMAVLLTLKAVLELHEFEVETASSTQEALQKMQGGVFQMVITDVRMEHEDAGFEVVMLTAYPPRNGNWNEYGAESLLVKPVGTEDLVRQVEALLVQHEDAKQRRRQLADHPSKFTEKEAGRRAS